MVGRILVVSHEGSFNAAPLSLAAETTRRTRRQRSGMADRVGQQVGNYTLTRLLGQGGFAEVYLGEHVYLKTPAALKLLQTTGARKTHLEGFLKEAQAIARLVHPHWN